MTYTPGSLVVITGTPLDNSDPDTTCWLDGDQPFGHLITVTKGATGVVLDSKDNNTLRLLLDDSSIIWIWSDSVNPT